MENNHDDDFWPHPRLRQPLPMDDLPPIDSPKGALFAAWGIALVAIVLFVLPIAIILASVTGKK